MGHMHHASIVTINSSSHAHSPQGADEGIGVTGSIQLNSSPSCRKHQGSRNLQQTWT